MKLLDRMLPEKDGRRKFVAIALTVLLAGLLTTWGIYVMGQYGIALFILTPLFIGISPVVLHGLKKRITRSDAFYIGFTALGIFMIALLLFAIEGLICILMALPIALILTAIGSLVGYAIVKKEPDNAPVAILLLLSLIPGMAFMEKDSQPALTSVTTTIEINADPETVWENVIEFPQLEEPTELIFKAGIAYPIKAKIEGNGPGAVRYCNFTTGSFVEPITVWDKPRLLRFDVLEQPASMKEISFWDIKAPHLHDYFVSRQGQFKLTKLPGGKTLLEGTTWYYHNIRPAFYWDFWSRDIIHKIHERVLKHIRKNAEG